MCLQLLENGYTDIGCQTLRLLVTIRVCGDNSASKTSNSMTTLNRMTNKERKGGFGPISL